MEEPLVLLMVLLGKQCLLRSVDHSSVLVVSWDHSLAE